MLKKVAFLGMLIFVGLIFFMLRNHAVFPTRLVNLKPSNSPAFTNPLGIDVMRSNNYPGSDLVIEQTLGDKGNFNEYIASYKSDGLKIYGLLAVPKGEKPKNGWPVVIFNHGYIAPEQYKTTERYVEYFGTFARNGYIVYKPDYRGNGNSEGQPEGAYYSPAYSVDVLNAVASVKRYRDVDVNRIGMWGHSMGGNITLRAIEVLPDIKAAVIWGGVVGSYDDLMNNWLRRVPFVPSSRQLALRNSGRSNLVNLYGVPKDNPNFWNKIDPTYHVDLITAPVQLHHGEADEEVPLAFSKNLDEMLMQAGKTVELFTYPGADHNISGNSFGVAIGRSLEFFNKYLKH